MASYFTSHTWKSFKRSPLLGRNLGESILKAFFGIYFLLSLLGLSGAAGILIKEYYPDKNLIHIGGAFILYYFVCAIVMRYVFQKFKGLHIRPYLHLPIKRMRIANYFLKRSFLDFFNFLPLALILPYMFIWVRPELNPLSFYGLLLFFIGLILVNHFLAYVLSKDLKGKSQWVLALLPLLIALLYWDYKGYIGLIDHLSTAIEVILQYEWIVLLPILLAVGLGLYIRRDLLQSINDLSQDSTSKLHDTSLELNFLKKYGVIGTIVQLEISLMLRSQRARKYVYTSFFMVLYPLFILSNSMLEGGVMKAISALFVSGAFSLNYGLFLFSWNSNHFDLIVTRIGNIEDYIKAKITLLCFGTLLFTLIGIPYIFWSIEFYFVILAVALFTISILPIIYLYLALYNSKKLDPNEGGAFSTSGMGIVHYLSMIPTMLVPGLIYYLSNKFLGDPWGIVNLALVGIIGMLLLRPYIKWAAGQFINRKYALREAFKSQ